MKLILENPYRVLGLPITATDREIAKRGDDLAMYIEMGMTKKFAYDYLLDINPITRTQESIQRAISQLELGNKKIFHSIFWFSNINSVDQLAFELIGEGELDKAEQIWLKQTSSEIGSKNASNYRNFAIFRILQLNSRMDSYLEEFITHGKSLFQGSGNSFNKTHLQQIGGDNNRLGKIDIQLFLMEELQKHIFSKTNETQTINIQKKFLEIFSDADAEIKEEATKKLTDEPLHRLEAALEECQRQRKANDSISKIAADKLVADVEKPLYKLRDILSKQNIHYQFIADKIASELLACSTSYYNWVTQTDDSYRPLDTSEKITSTAKTIAVSDEVIRKINEDLDTIKDLRKQKSVEPLVEKVKLALAQLPQFDSLTPNQIQAIPNSLNLLMNNGLPSLKSIKTKSRDEYRDWSGVFVPVTLGFSIVYVNETNKPNYSEILTILRQVNDLPMQTDVRERFRENFNILKSNNEQQNSSSGGCYIATLVYGDYDSSEVLILRDFRDNVLAKSIAGRLFIKLYYAFSPHLVKVLKNKHSIQDGIRKILDSVVRRLSK
jgi:hypothetical protein